MKISFLIIILIVIVSINSYDYNLVSGFTQDLGTLNSGTTYSFYLEAKSGQDVEVVFTTTSTGSQTNYLIFYAYIDGQSSYADKETFILRTNGTTLHTKINLNYVEVDNESKLIKYLSFTFTPAYTMYNTRVLATVTGASYEEVFTTLGIGVIMIILLPIICCITCIIIIICCCCKATSPTVYYQNPTAQPLYPVNQPQPQPYQQSPGYVPPYP